MKWSWKMGQIAGIGIFVHSTFLLLVAWIILVHMLQGSPVSAMLEGMLTIVVLFGLVILHELGHALTARRFGIETKDIILLPIGGMSRMEKMPERPAQEFLVALAGPGVNIVIAIVIFAFLYPVYGWALFTNLQVINGSFWAQLLWMNIVLAIFNLMPAFPMDGGRILRALLAVRLPRVRATRIAAGVGKVMAVLFGFLGFFFSPFLILIALFIWLGAEGEASMTEMSASMHDVPVKDAMVREFHILDPDTSLRDVAHQVISGFQKDFPVLENGRLIGVLGHQDLVKALDHLGADARVRDAMSKVFQTASISEMLDQVMVHMKEGPGTTIPIVEQEQVVGLITPENIAEYMALHGALNGKS